LLTSAQAVTMLKVFLTTDFLAGRYQERLMMLDD